MEQQVRRSDRQTVDKATARAGRKRQATNEAKAARRRQSRLRLAGLGLAGLVLLVVAGAWVFSQANRPLPGEAIASQGADHIKVGDTHPAYSTNPPTSGWHYDTPLAAGVYDTPQVDENMVHSLEHGHVIISYDCSKLSGESCDDVKTKLNDLSAQLKVWKLIVAPRDSMDTPIALTAWGRIQKLDTYDEQSIRSFVSAWRDKGPEKTPD